MKITCEARSDVGRKRKGNEDALFLNPGQKLYVVADGMGGHAAGEVASRVAVDAINEFVTLTGGNEEITWPFGLDDSISYEGNRLKTAIRHANRRVLEATRESAEYEGMATTVAAVLVDGTTANIAHVGDSRIYLWSGGSISQLTSDHSWVNVHVQDDAPTTSQPATLYTPYFAPDEPDSQTSGYGDDYGNDYVQDYPKNASGTSNNWRVRQGLINKYGNTKKETIGTRYGPNADCTMAPLQRLSTSFDSLVSYVNGLEAGGNTNIPMGLMWGWNTVSPNGPFKDGVAYNTPKHKKIIVLMTDGENTMSRRDTPNDGEYAGTAYIWQQRILKSDGTPLQQGATSSQRTQALDSRLRKLCDNIKAKGIDIYTIRVEVDTGTNELLKSCASGRDYFYDVHSSSTLTTVFESIAGQIAALHLSR